MEVLLVALLLMVALLLVHGTHLESRFRLRHFRGPRPAFLGGNMLQLARGSLVGLYQEWAQASSCCQPAQALGDAPSRESRPPPAPCPSPLQLYGPMFVIHLGKDPVVVVSGAPPPRPRRPPARTRLRPARTRAQLRRPTPPPASALQTLSWWGRLASGISLLSMTGRGSFAQAPWMAGAPGTSASLPCSRACSSPGKRAPALRSRLVPPPSLPGPASAQMHSTAQKSTHTNKQKYSHAP